MYTAAVICTEQSVVTGTTLSISAVPRGTLYSRVHSLCVRGTVLYTHARTVLSYTVQSTVCAVVSVSHVATERIYTFLNRTNKNYSLGLSSTAALHRVQKQDDASPPPRILSLHTAHSRESSVLCAYTQDRQQHYHTEVYCCSSSSAHI